LKNQYCSFQKYLLLLALVPTTLLGQPSRTLFAWPDSQQAALSLTFDDGRPSQLDIGLPLFDRLGAKVTFFVLPDSSGNPVTKRLDDWRKAVAAGHEIGNHSMSHPCSGNHPHFRNNAIEDYTLDRMRYQLVEANRRVVQLLGVTPRVFAYPCGHTFVGRGSGTTSYVPLVAQMFRAGRCWQSEWANDPSICDLAQVTGIRMDEKAFTDLRPLLAEAQEQGQWLVLVGHKIGVEGPETTRVQMLEDLITYARESTNRIWLAPMGEVAEYIHRQRVVAR
jgi:peptidoglycan/xylan/chitin deacetylase (PgdA/CDA1 family)